MQVTFDKADIGGQIAFTHAKFDGGEVTFDEVTVPGGGRITFDGATFSARSSIWRDGVKFRGTDPPTPDEQTNVY